MSTYPNPTQSICKAEINIKYKRCIVDPITNKIIANPEWTPEQENQLKALAPVTAEDFKKKAVLLASSRFNVYTNKEAATNKNFKKIDVETTIKRFWNPTDKSLETLKKNNYTKEVNLLFTSKITPEDFFVRLSEFKNKKNGKSKKWLLIKYFHYCITFLGLKTLHQCQTHLAKHLDCTRPWINEVIAELKKDGILESLYRHLSSCLYSMNHLFTDMFYRDQLEELFGGVYLRWNTYQQRKFTQEVTFKYKSIIKLNSLLIMEENLDQKGETPSKFSSIIQNLTKSMTKKMPVLCPGAK